MTRLVGFYPGSFDPLTNGHLDVIERACKLVDTLVVAVGTHATKKPLFSHADRLALLQATLEPVGRRTATEFHIVEFDGLAINAARQNGAKLIIRGLRDTTDYNYEMQMVGMNAQMAPDLQTVFLPSSPHVRHISATLVRQIAELGGDISAFVPANVLKALETSMNSSVKRAGAVFGILAIIAAAVFGAAITAPSASIGQETKPHLMLTLKDGTVDIELLPDVAPLHVERVVALAERGSYDNVLFHRVIDGFMAQTGDVQYGKEDGAEFNLGYAGMGGSDLPDVQAEFNATSFTRGVVGAARSQDPNTFNSQFFICFEDCTFLDNQYTVFGKVVAGMEFVDKITRGEPPASPDKIISAKIEQK